ncbi:crotonase/enoyl-CoA hydratase family protein [Maritalea sp.]|uniref:crotonase/enoyl-CoA hydratase family protein n=1 Tax=Maritalea sp. TaxID=2003361 RepID=UPI003EF5E218
MTKNLAKRQQSSSQEEFAYKVLPNSDLPFNRQENIDRFWPNLGQIESNFDISNSTVWSYMQFNGRAAFNPSLLDDFHKMHRNISSFKQEMQEHFKFLVLGSRDPDFFCLGGDLEHFSNCIARKDRQGLFEYGLSSVQILYQTWKTTNQGVITIGLVQGDALGGGFESLLSFDLICAEKGAKFGFPEHLFGLFPGMGGITLLGRKLGFAKAEQLVRTGKSMDAEELYDLGVVHILSEPGEGHKDIKKFISRTINRQEAACAYHLAAKRANPLSFSELEDIVKLWVDAAIQVTPKELKIMQRLVNAQSNKSNGG